MMIVHINILYLKDKTSIVSLAHSFSQTYFVGNKFNLKGARGKCKDPLYSN